jgi:fatty-acyl-CoA synthase
VNGAEPVDRRLQDAFVERFAPAGLAENVFLPAYGLAEATLAVAFPPLGRPTKALRADRAALSRGRYEPVSCAAEPHRELVSVGSPVVGMQVRLVDEAGRPVPEASVGAIEVRGTPVSSRGYDRHPEQTSRVLRSDGWLATGDLGLQRDGELYIVGRVKETVIVFGANYWASDIESVVRNIPDLPVHGVLAEQSRTDGRTGLGLVIETTARDAAAQGSMSQRIRHSLSAQLGITADQITYVRRGGISRTTSGKVVRRALTTVQPSPLIHAEGSSQASENAASTPGST